MLYSSLGETGFNVFVLRKSIPCGEFTAQIDLSSSVIRNIFENRNRRR